jgi:chitinase
MKVLKITQTILALLIITLITGCFYSIKVPTGTEDLSFMDRFTQAFEVLVPRSTADNIMLPTSIYGVKGDITWVSSDADVITPSGRVIRGDVDQKVKLTAYVIVDNVTGSWSKDVEVYAKENDLGLDKVKEIISSRIPTSTETNLTLINQIGGSSATITWSSSDTGLINTDGTVNRGFTDQLVTLTATIATLTEVTELKINVTVTAKVKPVEPDKKLTFAYVTDGNYRGLDHENAQKIDYINYAFGLISNNRLTVSHMRNISEVMALKNEGIKVILSIGGWGAEGFSDAASTQAMRDEFIASVITVVKDYQFDGIDIDWEYPGLGIAGIKYRSTDSVNFTYLLRDLRKALDDYKKGMILSVALGADRSFANRVELTKINEYLDYVHLMTYDMADFRVTTHHTNLYDSPNHGISASDAIEIYHTRGIPYEKLVLGAAFYGYKSTVASNTNKTGIGNPIISGTSGSLSFTAIKNRYLDNSSYTYYFDESAKAAWLYNGSTFITFEDEQSLKYKAEYVNDKGLAGIMFWELGLDTTNTLLNAIYQNLNK